MTTSDVYIELMGIVDSLEALAAKYDVLCGELNGAAEYECLARMVADHKNTVRLMRHKTIININKSPLIEKIMQGVCAIKKG